MSETYSNYRNQRISIPEEFEEVFSHFYFAENKSAHTITKTLLPSYQIILVFCFGANAVLYSSDSSQLKVDKCLVLGPVKKAFDYSLPPHSRILVANLKDDAFYRFFGTVSLAERLPLNPDSLLEENCFTALWNELNKIEDPTNQVNYVLAFCKPYLGQRNTITKQLINLKGAALNPIKELAENENQSERAIQLIHKKHLGYSAKEINRYVRFIKAVEMIEKTASKATKKDWFEIIDECGYYDQSQLIHDFKYYLNLSPTKYLKFQQDICNPIS